MTQTADSSLPPPIRVPVVYTGSSGERLLRVLKLRGVNGGLVSIGVTIALLYYGRVFLVTLSTAVMIYFILEPFVELLTRARIPRALASFLACLFALCAVCVAGVGVYKQATRLAENAPQYAQRISDLSDTVVTKLESMERTAESILAPKRRNRAAQKSSPVGSRGAREPFVPATPTPEVPEVRIRPERSPLIEFLHSHLGPLYETLLMASFVPFLVFFLLSWRRHLRPAFLQLFDGPNRIAAATSLDGIAAMVRAFVVGNFLLGVLLATASTALFWTFRLPYLMLIGPLSGFLSLVPAIGVPLALAPPLLASLAVYDSPAPYLIIGGVVVLFHLLAMNLLYPKIVGPRVHLNPLAVAVALMFWSALWGAAGMILAIPLTAGMKAVCDHVKTLERYGRLLGLGIAESAPNPEVS
jgi:predicted PurR-regulated permease PerM